MSAVTSSVDKLLVPSGLGGSGGGLIVSLPSDTAAGLIEVGGASFMSVYYVRISYKYTCIEVPILIYMYIYKYPK
jgi:hypothetical protein